MKLIPSKPTVICAGMLLSVSVMNVYAAERHIALALEHAQTTAKSGDVKTIANHADAAKGHIKVIDEHLKAGVTSLDAAIAHAKQGHSDLAKKSAEEAVLHLNAAQ
ncbi:small metal-binding protein SmbP [Methylomonas sp. BW4-1]|uniref:small metal-binding protein SmbP n=1 Tax=Methylomonas sp. BW4-1 TaxID=3376685 RepID=UPI0040422C0B